MCNARTEIICFSALAKNFSPLFPTRRSVIFKKEFLRNKSDVSEITFLIWSTMTKVCANSSLRIFIQASYLNWLFMLGVTMHLIRQDIGYFIPWPMVEEKVGLDYHVCSLSTTSIFWLWGSYYMLLVCFHLSPWTKWELPHLFLTPAIDKW